MKKTHKNHLKKLITRLILTFVLTGMTTIVFAATSPERSGVYAINNSRSETIKHTSGVSQSEKSPRLIAEHDETSHPDALAEPLADPPPPPKKPLPKKTGGKTGTGTTGGSGSGATGAGTPGPATPTGIGQDVIQNIGKLFAIILKGISKLLLPIIMLSGALMKSDFLFSGTMNETLLSIWDQVRDIVNVIFVVLLIVIALYNVLGLGEAAEGGAYLQLKKAIPKLVLGLILVNFSYLGVRMIVDVVNVGTSIAFAIPNSTGLPQKVTEEMKKNANLNALCSLTDKKEIALIGQLAPGTILPEATPTEEPLKEGEKKPKKIEICNEKAELTEEFKEIMTKWGIDGAVPIMALKFMNLQELDKVSKALASTKGKSVTDLTLQMLISIIMFILYGVSFIALFAVLLARAVMLWMVIVLSPLIAIQITFPQLLSKAGGSDYAGKVIKTLIAPIIVGFVLSVGFMILGTMQGVDYTNSPGLASISLTTAGAGLDTSNIDTFQQLLIAIGAVAFIFVGVNGALSDAIGGELAGTIMSTAKRAGGWLAKAPFMYTNLFPVKMPDGTTGHMAAGAALKLVENIPGALERKTSTQASEFMKGLFPGLEGGIGEAMGNITKGEHMGDYLGAIKGNSASDAAKEDKVIQATKTLLSPDKYREWDPKYKKDDRLRRAMQDLVDAKEDKAKREDAIRRIQTIIGENPDFAKSHEVENLKGEVKGLLTLKPDSAGLKALNDAIQGGKIKSQEDFDKFLADPKNSAAKGAYETAKTEQAAKASVQSELSPKMNTAATAALAAATAPPAEKPAKETAAKTEVEAFAKQINEQKFDEKIPEEDREKIIVELIDKSSLSPEAKGAIGAILSKQEGRAGKVGAVIAKKYKSPPATPAPDEETPPAVTGSETPPPKTPGSGTPPPPRHPTPPAGEPPPTMPPRPAPPAVPPTR